MHFTFKHTKYISFFLLAYVFRTLKNILYVCLFNQKEKMYFILKLLNKYGILNVKK